MLGVCCNCAVAYNVIPLRYPGRVREGENMVWHLVCVRVRLIVGESICGEYGYDKC